MAMDPLAGEPPDFAVTSVEDYESLIGPEAIDRILKKAARLSDLHVVNISSTYYGGGVAELLSSLTLLMNRAGIKTGWRVIEGRPDFFSVTKKMHNALHGAKSGTYRAKDPHLRGSRLRKRRPRASRSRPGHRPRSPTAAHDPPLQEEGAVDLALSRGPYRSQSGAVGLPQAPFVERYDAVVLSLPEYAQNLTTPQRFIMPAINPFSTTNKELTDAEIDERFARYDIPTDLPLVVQVSRFDKWKDPQGVIEAFRIARKQVDCTLVLLGNVATDDPEGQEVFESLCECADERIRILSVQDSALVNALQRRAAVVLQKSLREGFGLTVAEAMWKGAAVIGSKVGGIKHQIEDGVSGFLVENVEEAAERIVQLVNDEDLRRNLGERAQESVRQRFLMSRLMEDWLDLLASFETVFQLKATTQS